MPLVVPLLDEPRKGKLLERAYRVRVKPQVELELHGKFLREGHVSDAECRAEAFRERVQIDDAPRHIDARKRRDRAPRHAEFRVVVVLNDETAPRPRGGKRPRLVRSRPVEQVSPAGCGHDDSCRKLMSGHHVRHARAAFAQSRNVDAACGERDARAMHVLGAIYAPEQQIPRAFRREGALTSQQLDDQLVERL